MEKISATVRTPYGCEEAIIFLVHCHVSHLQGKRVHICMYVSIVIYEKTKIPYRYLGRAKFTVSWGKVTALGNLGQGFRALGRVTELIEVVDQLRSAHHLLKCDLMPVVG